MNCRRFQHGIYEYLDGSLSSWAQAAAQKHLASCTACRQVLSQQRQIAQSLSARLRGAAASLQLPPAVGQRVLAALADQRRAPEQQQDKAIFWRRLALRLAMAASGLLLLAGFFFFVQTPRPQATHPQPQLAGSEVSIQLSYVVPTYTFCREDGLVIDALSCQTNVVNQRIGAESAPLE